MVATQPNVPRIAATGSAIGCASTAEIPSDVQERRAEPIRICDDRRRGSIEAQAAKARARCAKAPARAADADRGRRGRRAGVGRDGHRGRSSRPPGCSATRSDKHVRLVCRGCRSSPTAPSAACARASCATAVWSTPGTCSSRAAPHASVRELLERGLVDRLGAEVARRGRPARGGRSSRRRCRTRTRSSASASTTARTRPRPGIDPPAAPTFFAKFRNALAPHGAQVTLPAASDKVDYEAEVAFVIGRRCRDVAEAEALDHVAGYMLLNDLSARDLQFATPQWMPGKVFDGSAPCGPALVTPDEAGPHDAHRDRADAERRDDAVGEHRGPDLLGAGARRPPLAPDDARARRHRLDRHALGRRQRARAARVAEGRRRGGRLLADARPARDDDRGASER